MANVPEHKMIRKFIEEVDIPEHVERTASAEFERNRHFLLEEKKLSCWRCGSDKDLEVHHLIEWSYANRVNWVKAQQVLTAFCFYPWSRDEAPKVADPDSLGNLIVLCADCHRGVDEEPGTKMHTGYGIHTVTFPAWLGEAAVKSDEDITPDGHVVA